MRVCVGWGTAGGGAGQTGAVVLEAIWVVSEWSQLVQPRGLCGVTPSARMGDP